MPAYTARCALCNHGSGERVFKQARVHFNYYWECTNERCPMHGTFTLGRTEWNRMQKAIRALREEAKP